MAESSLPPSTRVRYFGDYELLEKIGEGGMGVVFKARQVSLNKLVALKMIQSGNLATESEIKRFHIEAEAAANLEHPNIVTVYEVGEHEGKRYLTMRLVEGQNLAEHVTKLKSPLPDREAATILAKVARAIHHAHQRRILHRDLKPSNILLDARGEPHVADFGLAKRVDVPSNVSLSGAVLGTPGYMSPEQAEGKIRELTTATDVYGLGALLYFLLTGRAPFVGDTPLEILRKVREEEPVPPSQVLRSPADKHPSSRFSLRKLHSEIDKDLETICLHCLEKEPARRYGSAEALAEDFERWLRLEPITVRPPQQWEQMVKWARRKPVIAGLLAASAGIFLVGATGVIWQWRRAEAGELTARRNLYAADMLLAQGALEASNLGRAKELLLRHWRPGEIDLREWVWRWLWRRCQTDETGLLRGHSNAVHAVALSADGRWLATVSARDTFRLWDLVRKRCVASKENLSYARDSILFSKDGQRLFVSGHDQKQVQIWHVPTLEVVGRLQHQSSVNGIALSVDGEILAAGDQTGVKLWHVGEMRGLATVSVGRLLSSGVSSERVALSHDGRWLAFNDHEGRIYVWDWAALKQVAAFEGHRQIRPWGSAVLGLAFAPDGAKLVSSGGDLTLRLWDMASGREFKRLDGHTDAVWGVAFSPDGSTMASVSCDQTIRLWEVASWQERSLLRGHANEVWCLTFSSDGKNLVTGSKDETVRIWNARPPARKLPTWNIPSDVRSMALGVDGRSLAFLSTNGLFSVSQFSEWRVNPISPPTSAIRDVALIGINPEATCLIAAKSTGIMDTWELPSFKQGMAFTGHTGRVQGIAFSEDGRWLASAGVGDALLIHEVGNRTEAARFPKAHDYASKLALTHDGSLLGVSFDDDAVEVWDRASGRRRFQSTPHKSSVSGIVFMHRRPRFATASSDGTVKVWDLVSGQQIVEFRGARRGMNCLAISPDDRTLLAGTGEGTIKVWDLELNQEVATLQGHRLGVMSLAFSRDSRTMISASQDQVRVWEAPSFEEIDAASGEIDRPAKQTHLP